MTGPHESLALKMDDAAQRTLALLGLARRAGSLALGGTAVGKMVRQGARPVVILARDAGASQQRRVLNWSPVRGFVTGLVDRQDLAQRLGRGDLSVVAVADAGFVRGLIELGVVATSESMTAASSRIDDRRR
jgi:hypothetical protein